MTDARIGSDRLEALILGTPATRIGNAKLEAAIPSFATSNGCKVVSATFALSSTITIPPTTAGNCLVVCIGSNNASTSVTGITLGGSADNFASAVASSLVAGRQAAVIWVDPNCAGGQTSVVITGTNLTLTSPGGVMVLEISGLASSSVVDQTVSSSSSSSNPTTGTSSATTQPNEVAVAISLWTGGSPTAFAADPWLNLPGGTPGTPVFMVGVKMLTNTGTQSYTTTVSSTANASALVTLKAANAGGSSAGAMMASYI